jgi:D-aminopeptidase
LLGLALIATCLLTAGCGGPSDSQKDKAVAAAKTAYAKAKRAGTHLADGPCLAEKLPGLTDWVVDVAHDPRQKVDDEPANQCARYESGAAHHFVEIDPNGKLIRAQ